MTNKEPIGIDKPLPLSVGKLTDNMRITLRLLSGKPDGVKLSDLDERTVNALVKRKLVLVKWVGVTYTPKGRLVAAHQRVYLEG